MYPRFRLGSSLVAPQLTGTTRAASHRFASALTRVFRASPTVSSPYRGVHGVAVPSAGGWRTALSRGSGVSAKRGRCASQGAAATMGTTDAQAGVAGGSASGAGGDCPDDVPVACFPLTSGVFATILSGPLRQVVRLIEEKGFEVRIVGGAVRDILMGKVPKDIDLATNALPEETRALLMKQKVRVVATGLQHGTIIANLAGETFEVTTLRTDSDHDGRHATVEFTNSWREDALRRDLTINAMSANLRGELFDYFDGRMHLEQRRILFLGHAPSRIQEDYLRILRYFRFYGRLNAGKTPHDEATLAAIRDNVAGLKGISRERVWMEMRQILGGERASLHPTVRTMGTCHVLEHIDLPALPLVEPRLSHLDHVAKHTDNAVTRLVALLPSPGEVSRVLDRWCCSRSEQDLGAFVASHRAPEVPLALVDAQTILVHAPSQVVEKLRERLVQTLLYRADPDTATLVAEWVVPKFPLTGEVFEKAGLRPGRHFSTALTAVMRDWIDSDFSLTCDDMAPKAIAIAARSAEAAAHAQEEPRRKQKGKQGR